MADLISHNSIHRFAPVWTNIQGSRLKNPYPTNHYKGGDSRLMDNSLQSADLLYKFWAKVMCLHVFISLHIGQA